MEYMNYSVSVEAKTITCYWYNVRFHLHFCIPNHLSYFFFPSYFIPGFSFHFESNKQRSVFVCCVQFLLSNNNKVDETFIGFEIFIWTNKLGNLVGLIVNKGLVCTHDLRLPEIVLVPPPPSMFLTWDMRFPTLPSFSVHDRFLRPLRILLGMRCTKGSYKTIFKTGYLNVVKKHEP